MKVAALLPFLGIALLVVAPASGALIDVGVWDFNGETPYESDGTNEEFVANAGTLAGNATLLFHKGGGYGTDFALEDGQGTTVNAPAGTAAGNNVRLQRGERWNNAPITVNFDATGLSDIVLTFAARWYSGGVTGFQASYSTDGETFVDFGSQQSFPTDEYATVTVSPGSALDGAGDAYIRLTLTDDGGATWNKAHAVRLDNFLLQAVPEPATLAMLGVGGLALIGSRRARNRGA
ncbi:MAG: PEP-CTERM sorting domain-containing protein [Phycisphaerae bacterium]